MIRFLVLLSARLVSQLKLMKSNIIQTVLKLQESAETLCTVAYQTYNTIRYDTGTQVVNVQPKKLTDNQLSLPHGIRNNDMKIKQTDGHNYYAHPFLPLGRNGDDVHELS